MKNKPVKGYHLPALKSAMGDRGYFVTTMTFEEVASKIQAVEEVHQSKKLCDWIQRELITKHAKEIAKYLREDEAHFFNAIVVGVYGGNPQWAELDIADPRSELTTEEEDRINRSVGVLVMNGKEHLFPIDGQHRVAGIKQAVKESPELLDDEITVIMVGHAKTTVGKDRTRRLFVTLNKRAKKVSERDIVALDEDNGLAVVARKMIDEFELFSEGNVVSFGDSANIPEADKKSITSVIGLYQIVLSLYPRKRPGWPSLTAVKRARPEDDIINEIYEYNCRYWNLLVQNFKQLEETIAEQKRPPGYYRDPVRNHLLFRPAGQRAFARAVECLIERGRTLEDSVELLASKIEPWIQKPVWDRILWNSVGAKMIHNEIPAAETLLLRAAGEEARSEDAKSRLDKLLGG